MEFSLINTPKNEEEEIDSPRVSSLHSVNLSPTLNLNTLFTCTLHNLRLSTPTGWTNLHTLSPLYHLSSVSLSQENDHWPAQNFSFKSLDCCTAFSIVRIVCTIWKLSLFFSSTKFSFFNETTFYITNLQTQIQITLFSNLLHWLSIGTNSSYYSSNQRLKLASRTLKKTLNNSMN